MRRLSLLCFISFLPSLCELLGSRSVLPPSSPRAVRRRRAASGRMRRRHVGEGALVLGDGAMAGSRWRARAATHARPAHFLRTHRRGTAAFDACAPCFALRMMGARVSEPRTLRTRSCCASSRAAESVLAPALRYAYVYSWRLFPYFLRIMRLLLSLSSFLLLLHPRDALHSAYPRTSYTCMYIYHICACPCPIYPPPLSFRARVRVPCESKSSRAQRVRRADDCVLVRRRVLRERKSQYRSRYHSLRILEVRVRV
ncbi:hypothetical protein DFH09DRAFT_1186815, partial [Mycena vulgaris]